MMFTDLPRDLEWEILSRVPATTLTQFRSTCRRWYALFKDPRFIKKNLGKAERQVILKAYSGVFSVNINIHGINNSFDPSIEFTGKLNSLNDSEQVMISSAFQCDSLFLCHTEDNRLVVWNPCTGHTRWIQPSNRDTGNDEYFLGYENNNKSCHSFKILRSCSYRTEFEIYDFNYDSWKVLDYAAARFSFPRSSGVSLKGNIYWVARYENKPSTPKFLLRFDFKRKRFERLSLPSQCKKNNGYGVEASVFLSVVRDEKLSVLLERFDSDSLEKKVWVWVTDSKIDEAGYTNVQYFLVFVFSEFWTWDMLFVKSFLVDEENKKVLCCGKDQAKRAKNIFDIVGGDQKIHACKQVHGEIAQELDDDWPFLASYVPSLVQIEQLEANEKGDLID